MCNFLTKIRNQPSPECLYVFNQYGKLSEFSLDARGAKQHTRITDESPLEVHKATPPDKPSFFSLGHCKLNSSMESSTNEKQSRSESAIGSN